MHTTNHQHIVIAGSGNLAIAAYQTLAKTWRTAIKKGKVRITIISSNQDFEHPDLLGEIIVGRLERNAVVCPLSSIAKDAHIVFGDIDRIDRVSHMLEVTLTEGSKQYIYYNHLVLDTDITGDTLPANLPDFVQQISTYEDARQLCHQLDKIVRKAAGSRSILTARNMLRFVALVQNEKDLALASYIGKYLADSCSRYYNLKDVQPEIFLVELDKDHRLAATSSVTNYTAKMFSRFGICWIRDGILQRFAEDGVVLDNGCFIACSLMVHFNKTSPVAFSGNMKQQKTVRNFNTDAFLRLQGESHIWTGTLADTGNVKHHSDRKQGNLIARNIMLASECRFLEKYKPATIGYKGLLYSDAAYVSIPGMSFKNKLAWYVHISYLLFKLPVGKMAKNGLINLVSHFIWKKTKIESGLIHHAIPAPAAIRAAS